MTGPDHYKTAEKILDVLGEITKDQGGVRVELATGLLAEAQVHATLALAAATAQGALIGSTPDGLEGMSQRDADAWNEVAGTPTVTTPVGGDES